MESKEEIPSSEPPLEAVVNGEDIWHVLEATEIIQALQTSPKQGLSEEEARSRLEQFGPNELEEVAKPSLFRLVFEQFNNFIVIVLVVAALVAGLLGDYIEAMAILAIVVLNAILGVVQERRAEEALAALRRLAAPDALVLRGGHRQTYPARELVPGDVVFLEAGNLSPRI